MFIIIPCAVGDSAEMGFGRAPISWVAGNKNPGAADVQLKGLCPMQKQEASIGVLANRI